MATHATKYASWVIAVTSETDHIQHMIKDKRIPVSMIAEIIRRGQTITPTITITQAFDASNSSIAYPALNTQNDFSGNFSINALINSQLLHAAGVNILIGSDAAPPNTFGGYLIIPFGISKHRELANLVAADWTPAEALRAATSLPAEVHGLSDRGVIEVGKRAGLLLLGSNPLENIMATQDIQRVWAGGVEFEGVHNP